MNDAQKTILRASKKAAKKLDQSGVGMKTRYLTTFPGKGRVETWWDTYSRVWTTQRKDEQGVPYNEEPEYSPCRENAEIDHVYVVEHFDEPA